MHTTTRQRQPAKKAPHTPVPDREAAAPFAQAKCARNVGPGLSGQRLHSSTKARDQAAVKAHRMRVDVAIRSSASWSRTAKGWTQCAAWPHCAAWHGATPKLRHTRQPQAGCGPDHDRPATSYLAHIRRPSGQRCAAIRHHTHSLSSQHTWEWRSGPDREAATVPDPAPPQSKPYWKWLHTHESIAACYPIPKLPAGMSGYQVSETGYQHQLHASRSWVCHWRSLL